MDLRQLNRGSAAGASRTWVVLVALTCALGLTWCPTAQAGTYTMYSCDVPGQAIAPVTPWYWEAGANLTPVDSCSQGVGFGFYFPSAMSMPQGATSALTLDVTKDPGIFIRQVRVWAVSRLAGSGSPLFVATNAGATDGQVVNGDMFAPPGGDNLTSPYTSSVLPSTTYVFRIVLACLGGTPTDCNAGSRTALEVIGTESTLIESLAPTVSIEGGTLVTGGARSGGATLRYASADGQSGVESVEMLVDDAVIVRRNAECPHNGFAACPRTRSEEVPIDTTTLANGTHRVKLRVRDAAGNQAESASRTVEVNNEAGGGAGGATPSARGGALSMSFVGTSKRTLSVSFTGKPSVRGKLTDIAGAPIAAAPLTLVESVAGQPAKLTPVAKTGTDGRFAFRLRGGGRSRSFRVQYQASGGDPLRSLPLRLQVRASSTLTIALKGVRVRYSGRILSAGIPTRGINVQMQGRRRGGAWQAFASRKVPRTGRFAGTYRLRVRRPGVALQFRVVIAKTAGYPYSTGSSPTVTRIVR